MVIAFRATGLAAPSSAMFDAGLMIPDHDDTFSEPRECKSSLAEVE